MKPVKYGEEYDDAPQPLDLFETAAIAAQYIRQDPKSVRKEMHFKTKLCDCPTIGMYDRLYVVDPDMLLSPISSIVGDFAECMLRQGDGSYNWNAIERVEPLRGWVTPCAGDRKFYVRHIRVVSPSGGVRYQQSVFALSEERRKAYFVKIPNTEATHLETFGANKYFESIALVASVIEDAETCWRARFSGEYSIVAPLGDEVADAVFDSRDIPDGFSRRRAIFHKVNEHLRKPRTPGGRVAYVPTHGRGTTSISLGGLNLELTPPKRLTDSIRA